MKEDAPINKEKPTTIWEKILFDVAILKQG